MQKGRALFLLGGSPGGPSPLPGVSSRWESGPADSNPPSSTWFAAIPLRALERAERAQSAFLVLRGRTAPLKSEISRSSMFLPACRVRAVVGLTHFGPTHKRKHWGERAAARGERRTAM